jgi:hypothetical protein
MKTVIKKKCLYCNKEFELEIARRNQKCCSRRCGYAYHGLTYPVWNKGLTKETDQRIARAAIKDSNSCKGKVSWCKGLTKETDFRVANIAKKLSITLTGKPSILKGKTKDNCLSLAKASETMKEKIKSGIYTPINRYQKRLGFRKDLDRSFKSSWESNVARIFMLNNICWEYESNHCKFDLVDSLMIIDFYLPEKDIYIEVKGYLNLKSKEKMKSFINKYPEESKKVFIIDSDVYNVLKDKYQNLIKEWE